ncbi:rhodanese-like domain-containing protein [Leeuwenhoekiella sp. NPDC079379]|uniref:rhodanese-like domain-containing protein n=1 Tax=Leeuwenhoekiella sp. NPDC079379 TaxID=3364122 RepID=UPI0037CB494B
MALFLSKLFRTSKLQKLLNDKLSKDVTLISAQELHIKQSNYILLDTRARTEFEISHIKNAHWVSEEPSIELIKKLIPFFETPIVVYCSLGIRSNSVAQTLLAHGYTKVYNLYGGIFDWKDNGFKIVNPVGEPTEEVHTFSKQWSAYLKTGIKIH